MAVFVDGPHELGRPCFLVQGDGKVQVGCVVLEEGKHDPVPFHMCFDYVPGWHGEFCLVGAAQGHFGIAPGRMFLWVAIARLACAELDPVYDGVDEVERPGDAVEHIHDATHDRLPAG